MPPLIRDQNFVPVAGGVSSASPTTVLPLKIDSVTGRLYVDMVGGVGTVTSVATGTGLTGGPITSTGTISLSVALQPLATLAGNALKVLRVNAGETAVEYATVSSATVTITDDTTTNATMYPTWVTTASGAQSIKVSSTKLYFNPSTGLLTINPAGTGTALTNPTLTATNSVNNFTQISIQNKTAGVNASADHIAYPDNNTNDTTGFVDIGITSSSFSQAAYAITGANDAYLFGSAVSGAGKVGNLIIATDGTGSSNEIVFYTGGFDLTTRERLRITSAGTRLGLVGTSTGTLLLSGATSGTTTLIAQVSGGGTVTLPAGTTTLAGLATTQTFTGINTFTPAARSSGTAAYFTITTPADTGITAATESIGFSLTAATRTWADGTTTLQRERVFAAPTYNKTTTSATFTTAVNVDIADPIAGTGVTFTNKYSLRAANVLFTGVINAGSGPITLTDSAGKILSAALNTVAVAQGGTGGTSASITLFNNITGFSATGTTGTTSTNLVFSTSPVFTTPNIGAATATTINGNTFTTGTYTLTGTAGKTLTFQNSITLSGTDATTMTFPTTSKTLAANDGSNWTIASQAIGDIAYASSTTAYTRLAAVAVGQVLVSAGTGTAPAYSANPQVTTIELGAATDTTLARVAAGIISVEGYTMNGYATTATAAGTTALTITSAATQFFTGSSTQTVTLPTTSVVVGQPYRIVNNSTGIVTVQSSGANTIQILGAGMSAVFTAIIATPTTAANWSCALTSSTGQNIATTAAANAATVNLAYVTNTVTNNSAATLTITIPTAGAIDGELRVIRVLDFSAAAQTLTLVNTENSTVTPAATTNGSTTLPYTFGVQYNAGTSKWRVIASA